MLIDDARALMRADPKLPIVPSMLEGALCFDVTLIERYLDDVLPQRRSVDIVEDIPTIAPLADRWWMESAAHWGVLLHTAAIRDEQTGWDDPLDLVHGHWDAPVEQAHWIVMAQHLHHLPSGQILCGYFAHLLALQADGRPIDWARCAFHPPGVVADEPEDEMWAYWWRNLYVTCTATCFAHCKGVTTTERQQPRQQRRAAERAGRPALVSYRTIDIAPVTRILRDEGHVEKTGIKKALHITRGHFAHYTDDAPLFGKYTGTFYKPMHVRGTLERGAVVKDYRVLPGEETPPPPTP